MSASTALDIIAQESGRDSAAYLLACRRAAYGRHADIIAQASAILAGMQQRRGRILDIAA